MWDGIESIDEQEQQEELRKGESEEQNFISTRRSVVHEDHTIRPDGST
jgi:hypothetical protein